MRGKISARVYVERDGISPLSNVTTDFNVEEHAEPVREIGRLLALRKDIIKGWKLSESASKAEGEEKQKAISELEEFLKGREDRLFLDFFSELAEFQLQSGNREKAIETLRTVVRISPGMAATIDPSFKEDVLG